MALADPVRNEVVLVPAGAFVQGDGVSTCGLDEREVTLTRDFYLGRHEVTNAEYLPVLQWAYSAGHVTVNADSIFDDMDGSTELIMRMFDDQAEIQFDGGTFYLREAPRALEHAYPNGYDPSQHPVKHVTWFGAVRYCDWLSMRAGLPRAYQQEFDPEWQEWLCNAGFPYDAEGYRLPTDAEWEYAAQYDDERLYPWGNAEPECDLANFKPIGSYGCVRWTAEVGSYGATPLGLTDMAGNVWEWCNDVHWCHVGTAPATDPTGAEVWESDARSTLGGAWDSYPQYVACACRGSGGPMGWDKRYDFRIAKTAPWSLDAQNPSDPPCTWPPTTPIRSRTRPRSSLQAQPASRQRPPSMTPRAG